MEKDGQARVNGHLSDHLTLDQFVATSHKQFWEDQRHPSQEVMDNAYRFASEYWEEVWDLCGPQQLTSGWRSHLLNAYVGGSQVPPSAHMFGRAGDHIPLSMALVDAFERIRKSAIPYDKLILERRSTDGVVWIHGQIRSDPHPPRRLALFNLGRGFEIYSPSHPEIVELRKA